MAKLACSIIIVSYYTNEALFECLDAVFAEQRDDFQLEVIVVDNGNSSAIKAHLFELDATKKIKLISGQGNIGFAAGCNLGVSVASAATILLLNPDCIAQPGALSQLQQCLLGSSDKKETLVSGWLSNADGSEQRGLRRNILSPRSLLLEMLPLINKLPYFRQLRLNLTNQKIEGDTIVVGACSGACMMMKKSLYDALKGMDEGYFLHVDDLDFCKKLAQIDGQIIIDTQAIFSHYKSTSSASQKRIDFYKRDGFIRYFKKYHPVFWRSPLGWALYLAIELNARRPTKSNK